MIGQVHTAPWALGHIAAAGADHLSAVAPPVEKENGLLTKLQILPYFFVQRLTDGRIISLPQLLPHIHHRNMRQRVLVIPLSQQRQAVIPFLCQICRLYRRRSRPKHQPCALFGAAVFCNVPGMVARRFFRFVGSLLLLVYNDHAQILQRSKHRRPGTQHNFCQTLSNAFILIVSLRNAQATV